MVSNGLNTADNYFKPSQPWSRDEWKDTDEDIRGENGNNEIDMMMVTTSKPVEKNENVDWRTPRSGNMLGLFRTKPVSGQPANPTISGNGSIGDDPSKIDNIIQATTAKDHVILMRSDKAAGVKSAGKPSAEKKIRNLGNNTNSPTTQIFITQGSFNYVSIFTLSLNPY